MEKTMLFFERLKSYTLPVSQRLIIRLIIANDATPVKLYRSTDMRSIRDELTEAKLYNKGMITIPENIQKEFDAVDRKIETFYEGFIVSSIATVTLHDVKHASKLTTYAKIILDVINCNLLEIPKEYFFLGEFDFFLYLHKQLHGKELSLIKNY